jgi:hypothetical protein
MARKDTSVKFSPEDIKGFSSNQIGTSKPDQFFVAHISPREMYDAYVYNLCVAKVVFLEKLDEEVDRFEKSMVELMEKNYRFNGTNNQEIRLRWYSISLKSGCFCPDAATWVSNKGRMKFAR